MSYNLICNHHIDQKREKAVKEYGIKFNMQPSHSLHYQVAKVLQPK